MRESAAPPSPGFEGKNIARTSDAELIRRLREGGEEAYEELWRRHVSSALNFARRLNPNLADDLVSEAFLAAHHQITVAGNGPQAAFRAYLFATIRNTFYSWSRENRHLVLDPDVDRIDSAHDGLLVLERDATAGELLDAFRSLPERWQRVLWLSEIEGVKRPAIAEELDLKPNAVSVLLRRARAGLRASWLAQQIPERLRDDPAHAARLLPDLITGRRDGHSIRSARAHLRSCAMCAELNAELRRSYSEVSKVTLSVAGFAALGFTIPAASAVPGATAGVSAAALGFSGALTAGATVLAASVAATVVLVLAPWDQSPPETPVAEGTSEQGPDVGSQGSGSQEGSREQKGSSQESTETLSSPETATPEGPYVSEWYGRGVVDPLIPEADAKYDFDTIRERPNTPAGGMNPANPADGSGTTDGASEEPADPLAAPAVRGFEGVSVLEISEASTTGVVALVEGTPGGEVCVHIDSGQSAVLPLSAQGKLSLRLRFLTEGFYTVSFAACAGAETGAWVDHGLYVSDPAVVWGPFSEPSKPLAEIEVLPEG